MKKSSRKSSIVCAHALVTTLFVGIGCTLDGDVFVEAEDIDMDRAMVAAPLLVTVTKGLTGERLAGVPVSAYEVLGDGSMVRRSSATSDSSGRIAFDLGLGWDRVFYLRARPYNAGTMWSPAITSRDAMELRVGTSPVTLLDESGAALVNRQLIGYSIENGRRVWYKDGSTDSTGTVHFDFEALDEGATIIVMARDPLGTGVDYESSEIHAEGPVTIFAGAATQPPAGDPPIGDPSAGDPTSASTTTSCTAAAPTGPIYYVSERGKDRNDGSPGAPWATIAHAFSKVPDGATILVKPGTYTGTTTLRGNFSRGVVLRSETPYQARLRSTSKQVLRCYGCSGITIEGFDIAHARSGAGPLVFQIEGERARNVVVRNNIIHDSFNNDLLKVNNGASHITVERNLFYNQSGSDEHIDINSVADVVVQDNIFFNDFEASGRRNGNNTSSYIVIKDSNGYDDDFLGAQRITVRRNIFMNWQGTSGHNFVLVGEDAKPYIEARDIVVENNLYLGNSKNQIRAPFGVKSGQDVLFRNNTIVGDLPTRAFAMRLNAENSSIQNRNIRFYNNIWSDPTGTMQDFSTTPRGETASFELDTNLYWNGGRAIPVKSSELINWNNDGRAINRDPLIPNPSNAIAPSWDGTRFADGSRDICAVFNALVTTHGRPASGSPAIDAARADKAPDHDILGRRRSKPDLGAFER
jgi:hypothetical protein